MDFGIELFSLIASGILITVICAFLCGLCDPIRDAGRYVMSEKYIRRHYKLKRSKIFFFPVYFTNKKDKSGYISRRTFWEVMSIYLYYLLFVVAEVVKFLATGSGIFAAGSFGFMALLLLPGFMCIVFCVISLFKKEDIDEDIALAAKKPKTDGAKKETRSSEDGILPQEDDFSGTGKKPGSKKR